ncbi:MAG: Gldg family protein [Bdellovibrionales bacterium]|nr:Gldg family protein [Bdellovibrionales bacterium]
MKKTFAIARKEVAAYFASPTAYLFLGAFLGVTLFLVFWVETFFARNIADVRPLFEWMPVLLIFLVSALTMRMWSDERRMGTIEVLLTLPVSGVALVLGKFLAVMCLVSIALLMTLPIPWSVSFMGLLDWGPIYGGYVAAVLLAAMYTAIGLFVSARSDNQIVSLLTSVGICFIFYLVGSGPVVSLFGSEVGELLKQVGSGSRFDSITRGVLDFRDLYYYLSLTAVFLAWNLYSLELLRWEADLDSQKRRRRGFGLVLLLLAANVLAANLWLAPLSALRADLTKGQVYSISAATERYLDQLQEPLLLRGYFSNRTHPELAPLAAQVRDLIREYEVVGAGRVFAEFIDPLEQPELEQEANQKYNIRSVPFQIADRYQSSLVNAYFHVLVQYGDQFEVLDFQDLIEVKMRGEAAMEVRLRNPEYDITRTIKKVLYSFRTSDELLTRLKRPVEFVGYFSPDARLPEGLPAFRVELEKALAAVAERAPEQFSYKIVDPEADGGAVAAAIEEQFGLGPMVVSLLDPTPFYFYLTLQDGERIVQLAVPDDATVDAIGKAVETGLKRFSTGFLKSVGLVLPHAAPTDDHAHAHAHGALDTKQFTLLKEKLRQSYAVEEIDVNAGVIPAAIDLVLVVAPEEMSERGVFALDQFLMKGGTVVLLASPFSVTTTAQSIEAKPKATGLEKWLRHHGIRIEELMVLDAQNEAFPVPIERDTGGVKVQEIQLIPYAYFVDVRADGMESRSGITSGLPQVTLNWSSPIEFTPESAEAKTDAVSLLMSSEQSSRQYPSQLLPDFETLPPHGFVLPSQSERYTLAGLRQGRFLSLFAGRRSPLLEREQAQRKDLANDDKAKTSVAAGGYAVLDRSVESARIIVVGSSDFVADETLELSAAIGSSRYLNSLQLVENAIDWSLEERGLLSIRGRGHFARTLLPMSDDLRLLFEYMIYFAMLVELGALYGLYRMVRRKRRRFYRSIVSTGAAV